ncbi:hypothetical protein M8J76_004319 [Diaphorina citri]|nr:hypothetical protein M8J76_004319 [Diaphorina citri]
MPTQRSPVRQGGSQTVYSGPLGNHTIRSLENVSGIVNDQRKDHVGGESERNIIGPKAATLMNGVNKLLQLISELRDNALKVPNTKMEIRKGIELAEAASTKVISDLKGVILLDKEKYVQLKESQNLGPAKAEELKEAIARAKENLREDSTINIQDLLNKEWPEDAFSSTKVVAGDPSAIKVGSLALWITKEGRKNQGLLNTAKKGYPEIDDVTMDGKVANGFQIIERMIRCRGKDTKLTYCFLAEGESTNDFIPGFLKIKKEMEAEESKQMKNNQLNIAAVENTSLLRKAAEVVFHGSELQVTFLVPPNSRLTPNRRAGPPKQNGPAQGRININPGNMSYADMTKIVKESIDLDAIGVEVKNVKEGKNNNLIIFTKDKKGRDTLRQEILDKVSPRIPEMKIDVAGSKTTFIISQIESTVETEEIKSAISKILQESETEHNEDIGDLDVKTNDGKWGTKTAEVTLEKTQATKLKAMEKIKLGWSICTVREKAKILRCYACLKMGHAHYECRQKRGPQKILRCFNCTLDGHKAEDCKNAARCNTCNSNGHRADSTRCPKLRNRLYKI